MADFSVNGALFPQSADDLKKRLGERFDSTKNYPQLDGVLNIPADAAFALAQYIMEGSQSVIARRFLSRSAAGSAPAGQARLTSVCL